MLNKKEILNIFAITLILAFSITLIETINIFIIALLSVFIVLLVNIIAKKLTSYYLDSEIEIKLWEFKRFGYKKHWHMKKPFPAGAFFPIISKVLLFPFNGFVWMASLIFDVKSKTYRAAKRHGLYKFSEISENHIGIIAAAGIFANLVFALLGYLTGFVEFAKYNIWFAFFNMLPISDLDGNKIFFGNLVTWITLACITIIALGYTIFLI